MSKDKGRIVEEVFTPIGKRYRVKADLSFDDLRVALSFKEIVLAFETSQDRDRRKRERVGKVL